jgi:ribonuclease HII
MSEQEGPLSFDRMYWQKGYFPFAGVDEAGRGALFGPVVAGAVILDPEKKMSSFCDSKLISGKKREQLFDELIENGHSYSVGIVDASEIDRINILEAAMEAMRLAVEGLYPAPKLVLVDGNRKPQVKCDVEAVVGGDRRSLSISAASIVAKVSRDRMMIKFDSEYPGYGLKKHMGYGTKEHVAALREMGPTLLHRKSFKPVTEAGKGLWD